MQKKNAKQKRNVRNLAAVSTLTAIILIVSTYAWFIGLDEVRVNDFTVTIAATDSLLLSLDAGDNWSESITVEPTTIETIYTGNTNSWTGRDADGDAIGLIPMSSIGQMDATSSRMILFEKASLTQNTEGIRLMASRVNNFDPAATGTDAEIPGYIAFDLFIKNFTGAQYISDLNPLDEEAIYLTDESSVSVGLTGVATENEIREAAGIENSVRVAFTQIGRVVGTESDTTIIGGITCADTDTAGDGSGDPEVTGICRDATIWEPNDTKHVDGAVDYFAYACGYRGTASAPTGAGYTTKGCTAIADGTFYETYAVASPIASADDVNVYDGDYNGVAEADFPVAATGALNEGEALIQAVDTFTDTEKLLNDDNRPSLMTLAPNSITKVRIYIYLEGQDVDNYDWAIEGKQIAVDFGFTKQIFETN